MNTAANFIGRVVITLLLGSIFALLIVGGLDLISTIWHLIYPEYRAYVTGAIGAACARPAWKLSMEEGKRP